MQLLWVCSMLTYFAILFILISLLQQIHAQLKNILNVADKFLKLNNKKNSTQ